MTAKLLMLASFGLVAGLAPAKAQPACDRPDVEIADGPFAGIETRHELPPPEGLNGPPGCLEGARRRVLVRFTPPYDGYWTFTLGAWSTGIPVGITLRTDCDDGAPLGCAVGLDRTRLIHAGDRQIFLRAGRAVFLLLEAAAPLPERWIFELEGSQGPFLAPRIWELVAFREGATLAWRAEVDDHREGFSGYELELLDADGAPTSAASFDWDPRRHWSVGNPVRGRRDDLRPGAATRLRIRVLGARDLWSEAAEADLQPLPVRAAGEVCDGTGVEDRCADGAECRPAWAANARCEDVSLPAIDEATATASADGGALAVRARGRSREPPLAVQLRVGDEPHRLALGDGAVDRVAHDGERFEVTVTRRIAVPPGEEVQVSVVTDFDGVSQPARVPIGAAPVAGRGEACDPAGALATCPAGVSCVPGPEGGVCAAPDACPADWRVHRMVPDAAPRQWIAEGDTTGGANRVDPPCGYEDAEDDVAEFVAPAAGRWQFTVTGPDGGVAHHLHAWPTCAVVHADFALGCGRPWDDAPVVLTLGAGQRVFLFVAGRGPWRLVARPAEPPIAENAAAFYRPGTLLVRVRGADADGDVQRVELEALDAAGRPLVRIAPSAPTEIESADGAFVLRHRLWLGSHLDRWPPTRVRGAVIDRGGARAAFEAAVEPPHDAAPGEVCDASGLEGRCPEGVECVPDDDPERTERGVCHAPRCPDEGDVRPLGRVDARRGPGWRADGDTTGAPTWGGSVCGGASGGHVYRFVAPTGGGYEVAVEAGGDARMVVYARPGDCGPDEDPWDCAADGDAVVLEMGRGEEALLFVEGFGGDAGPYTLRVEQLWEHQAGEHDGG